MRLAASAESGGQLADQAGLIEGHTSLLLAILSSQATVIMAQPGEAAHATAAHVVQGQLAAAGQAIDSQMPVQALSTVRYCVAICSLHHSRLAPEL
jgi:hypothetical protein